MYLRPKLSAMIGANTLQEFVVARQAEFAGATGDLSRLLTDIGTAAKMVNRHVNRAGLSGILGTHQENGSGTRNVQGEAQQKLDVYADDTFNRVLGSCLKVGGIVSEEQPDIIHVDHTERGQGNGYGKYVVCIDPLDGSSNVDVNISVGTIFGIHKRRSPLTGPATPQDFMQPAKDLVAAGYVLYGSSTMLVYSTGCGVNGFTFDPSIGEFFLSHPNMKFPEESTVYSINDANLDKSIPGVKPYVKDCRRRGLTARYTGALVADFHRNLIQGGIYMYPGTDAKPGGKLRMLYEAQPLAFLANQAGGKTRCHHQDLLHALPTSLHQRTPLFTGHPSEIDRLVQALEAQKATV
jgi:fructose-1,6-bisphosphatase I